MLGNDKKIVVAFDLYGTLLSTESIAVELAKLFGEDEAQSVAAQWRRYQLEYTWRINSMGKGLFVIPSSHPINSFILLKEKKTVFSRYHLLIAVYLSQGIYRPFSKITRGALLHAVAEAGLSLADSDVDKLMTAYDSLHTFPEVSSALKAVSENKSVEAYIFTNGTNEMARASVETSPGLGPHAAVFKGFVTVHELEVFKPDKRTYEHLLGKTGKEKGTGRVWVVSANPFDAVGAKAAGLESAWVDRAGKGWLDQLGDVIGGIRPTVVVSGVDEAVREITRRTE